MATRSRGGRTMTMNPSRVKIQPGTPVDDDGDVKCTGHQMKCPKLRAGPKTKNAGRSFYCCPLPRDDPSRCKFFKWHDELFSGSDSAAAPGTPSGSTRAATLVQATNHQNTLGQSPAARYGRPLGASGTTVPAAPVTTPSARRVIPPPPPPGAEEDEDEMEEIDWEKVDADEMEREAIASTPTSSLATPSHLRTVSTTTGVHAPGSVTFAARLREVAGDSLGKRARDSQLEETLVQGDDTERTPKRASIEAGASNPFISTPSSSTSVLSPPHNYLSPTLSSLEQLSEHLHRQDRLLRAAEQMKKGMRSTIKGLQDKNRELEERVRELEKRLGAG
ncbi:hypothetical protein IAU60_003935 [Kwoniella sp. DSM 27419]